MAKYDYLKIATISPKVVVANPKKNQIEIIKLINETKADILVFPELAIPGYSTGDFVFNQDLLEDSLFSLKEIVKNVYKKIVLIGSTLEYNGSLYNVCYVIQNQKIIGIIPKRFLPRSKEFYEPRFFASGNKLIEEVSYIETFGYKIPVGDLLFKTQDGKLSFAIEICGDMWSVDAPHNRLYSAGAQIVFNLSASPYNTLKENDRRVICNSASLTGEGAYVYCSCSTSESTSSVIFERVHMFCELGTVLYEKNDFSLETEVSICDIDLERIRNKRLSTGYLHDTKIDNFTEVYFELTQSQEFELSYPIVETPFKNIVLKDYDMIFEALVNGVLKRCLVTKCEKLVLGVSGGLDSTLTLLILKEVEKRLNKKDYIIGCVLPALATSKETMEKCISLLNTTKTTINQVDLSNEVLSQLKLLNHNNDEDIVYENSQARYRTYYLLDLANMVKGLMIGTSDLSEAALGFSTFGGDHLANYDAIAGLPKTAVQAMIKTYIEKTDNNELKKILTTILESKITPELKNNQVTESVLGEYKINDFIMYHYLGYGAKRERIIYLLNQTFKGIDANKYYDNFVSRFKKNQFKRLTAPESIKIFDISLNPSDFQLIGDME